MILLNIVNYSLVFLDKKIAVLLPFLPLLG